MIYNENITTNAGQGVKVYEGTTGQLLMKKGARYKEEAQKEMAQAKDLEEKGYKLGLSQGINELSTNEQLMSNPQALGQELDKLAQNITSNISDEEMKINVLTDFELSKGAYINKATANMKRVQAENARSAAFDSVYSGIDSLSTSFGNAINGNYDNNDIVNYQYSVDRIKANINARNLDGTYMFSDSQRRAMVKDIGQAQFKAFKDGFDTLSDVDKQAVKEKIASDSYDFYVGNDTYVNIKDVVGDEDYNNIKKYVAEDDYRKVELEKKRIELDKSLRKIKQYNTEVGLSDELDTMDALDALKILDENQSLVSDKFYNAKKKALLSSKGIDAETQAEVASEIILDIAAINADDAKDFFNKSNNILVKIEEAYASGNLDMKDKKTLTKNLMKRQGSNLPKLIEEESAWYMPYDFSDAKSDFDTLGTKSNQAMLEYIRTLSDNDYNTKQKKQLVQTIIRSYKNKELNKAINRIRIGDVVSGYRYKGGDTQNPDSWEKI